VHPRAAWIKQQRLVPQELLILFKRSPRGAGHNCAEFAAEPPVDDPEKHAVAISSAA
jgi:hypothetical protein